MMTETRAQVHADRAVIVGLGATGFACARHLHDLGEAVAVTDSRAHPPRATALASTCPQVPVSFGAIDRELLMTAREIVISPGVDPRRPEIADAVAAGVPLIGEIDLFRRATSAPVVAITGSNGKSTVTTLLGRMAEAAGLDVAVGGNLGTPALELLRVPEPALFVLELSSFQLETATCLDAEAAVVLNISADHMDRYDDLDHYTSAKARIFEGRGVMVLNADDPGVMALGRDHRDIRYFTLAPPRGRGDAGVAEHAGEPWLMLGDAPVLAASRLGLPGRHGLANALAALALGAVVGLPRRAMVEALCSFRGLAHRMERLNVAGDVDWVNDSKATNIGATAAAVAGLDQPLLLIAGGQGKGQDFSALASALQHQAGRVREVLLIGVDAPRLERALGGVCRVTRVDTLDAAVAAAVERAQPGDMVLLSPACASFDQFAGFEARGDAFRRLVLEAHRG